MCIRDSSNITTASHAYIDNNHEGLDLERIELLRGMNSRVSVSYTHLLLIYNNIKKHTMANIKPLGQRVLVKRIEAETKTAGGLFLPDTVGRGIGPLRRACGRPGNLGRREAPNRGREDEQRKGQ